MRSVPARSLEAARLAAVLPALAVLLPALAAPPRARAEEPPATWILDGAALAGTRRRAAAGDPALAPALEKLKDDAEKALKQGPLSVLDKSTTPPSGDKHDYMSVAPYWWPDPSKPDGKPYIRKDGERNPDRKSLGDADAFGRMQGAVTTLALARFFNGRDAFAEHAARLLRAWFLDEASRMNPNLNYGQSVPGRTDGRGAGIVDAAGLIHLVDAAILLEASAAWTEADRKGLRAWFSLYLDWLLESPHGKDEAKTSNNHATQYDAQVACYALYTGRRDVARRVLERVAALRIDTQVKPDGQMPQELARTKSWDYCCVNANNLLNLARLGGHVDVDLWGYASKEGRSLRKAVDFLVPYATGEKAWTAKQIDEFQPERLATALRRAAARWPDGPYASALKRVPGLSAKDRDRLLHPLPAGD
jgi:hypothetical protein